MKINRVINGVEVEIELTHDEIAEAYLEHEHFYDCESVRGYLNSGCYEEFEGLSDEEWERAVHEIAFEARHQMEEYGYDEWDARDIARNKYVKDLLQEHEAQGAAVVAEVLSVAENRVGNEQKGDSVREIDL